MITDPSWLYSTIAQSSAAIVAIVGGFITAAVLMLMSEKRSMQKQKSEKENHIKYLEDMKEKITKERDTLEIDEFLDSVTEELIGMSELPSTEEFITNHQEAQSLNLTLLNTRYLNLCDGISRAKDFFSQHMNKLAEDDDVRFEEWIKIKDFKISEEDYEMLQRVYDNLQDRVEKEIRKESQNNSLLPTWELPDLPHITPQAVIREQEKAIDLIKKIEYEILALEKDVSNLDIQLKAFSYPSNLKGGIFVLGYLAIFDIFWPVLVISSMAFSDLAKNITLYSFYLGILLVFVYIVIQLRELRRK